ncbi:MAG: cell division protein FtsQ/DivIB [bacterium]|nr:cell division protein FtsQ/DivIB [bacterium]
MQNNNPKKQVRFQRPEFREKLEKARGFARKPRGPHSPLVPILALLFLLAAVYFLTISKIFLITNAEVSGADPEQIIDVLKRLGTKRFYLIPKNHILILTKNRLLEGLRENLPNVRKITSYRRILPDSIELTVEMREPRYVWQSGSNYYLLDQDGVIFEKIPDYLPESFPQIIISDGAAENLAVGQDLGITESLNFLAKLRDLWPGEIRDIEVVGVELPGRKSPDIFVSTSIGFRVYFDVKRSVAAHLANLKLLLYQEINPETYTGLSYIDLRLPNIAYYCYLDAPCAPENATSTIPNL